MQRTFRFTAFPLFVSLVAALGGFLFGYHTSVISGALLFISQDFHLSVFEQELVVSTLLIGALLGALGGGILTDSLGRKKTLFLTVFLFAVGTFCLADGRDFDLLLVGRFLTGLAIGVTSVAVPLYIAEMSPPEKRGLFVSFNQLAITIGILVAYIVTYVYAEKQLWRDMFFFAFFPILLQAIGLCWVAETPSWLIGRNRRREAEKVLHRMRFAHPRESLIPIEEQEDRIETSHWKELFSPKMRKSFLVGIGISVFQQITGINTVIYYAPSIFQLAGVGTAKAAILATVWVGGVNVLLTCVALWLIDRLGRRPLLIGGLIGMSAALAVLGFSFFTGDDQMGIIAVGSLIVYVSFFAVSLGPVAWLILSEVYPAGVRGRAMGIATFANWTCNYVVSLTFLSLIESIGSGPTFWMYGLICLIALWFVYTQVPETKGKTFEEIQSFWKN